MQIVTFLLLLSMHLSSFLRQKLVKSIILDVIPLALRFIIPSNCTLTTFCITIVVLGNGTLNAAYKSIAINEHCLDPRVVA